jgi:hypothetical protein
LLRSSSVTRPWSSLEPSSASRGSASGRSPRSLTAQVSPLLSSYV